ncbi:hypothetical protein AYJ57_13185 [Salipiger sp. CCB-MM3]|uniref:PepSY-associated TM helix domain-containing protein n=1 Tax=Salipiger sp. CCB-MM3 TaxID=1792508 RepID=UPI00080ABE2F|nr:PepSY-associated TM helix domain-containing protein [Salipiger sp. CCB-MM3]ANT61240.1 hypothetical protein AYJ57_13185 [Salipiger sp. CCB-MM3]
MASISAFRLHAWLGLVFSLLLWAVFLSGTLLVFGEQADKAVYPQTRVNSAPAELVSFGQVYDAAKASAPNTQIVSIRRDTTAGRADQVVIKTPDGETQHLWIDPTTRDATGTTPTMGPRRLLHDLHSHLFIYNAFGAYLVTGLSVVLAVSIFTGLASNRWFSGDWFPKLSLKRSRRAFWRALHRILAITSLPFLIAITLTGAYYLLADPLNLWGRLPAAEPAAERAAALPEGFDGTQLDRAVSVARTSFPELAIHQISLPTWRGDGIKFDGQASAPMVGDVANRVTVDPVTLDVLGRYRAEDLSAARRITEAVDLLHSGHWGGRAVQVIWFAFGLMGTMLAFTGALLCTRSLRRNPASAASASSRALPMSLPRSLLGWPWVSLLFLAIIALASSLSIKLIASREDGQKSAQLPTALVTGAGPGIEVSSEEGPGK